MTDEDGHPDAGEVAEATGGLALGAGVMEPVGSSMTRRRASNMNALKRFASWSKPLLAWSLPWSEAHLCGRLGSYRPSSGF